MTVKIISRIVKIISLIVLAMCLKVKISLIFVDYFSEQNSIVLIISKSLRHTGLMNANVL